LAVVVLVVVFKCEIFIPDNGRSCSIAIGKYLVEAMIVVAVVKLSGVVL